MESGPSGGRSPLPQVVRGRWVSVTVHELVPPAQAGLERFRIEAVQPVRGARPTEWKAGLSITRRESSTLPGPEPEPRDGRGWSGFVDGDLSTAPEHATQLIRSWQHNPFRVALMLACKHSSRFWTQSPEQRRFDHCGFPDRAGVQRGPILRKVVRQLQRTAADTAPAGWDTLAQFEMLPEHVAHVREYLAERRESASASGLVEREAEIWMVKSIDLHDANSGANSSGA